MSAQEIIAELPNLSREELLQVDIRLRELLPPASDGKHWGEALLEVAGTAKGLPADYAHQHDHYLHGTSKR